MGSQVIVPPPTGDATTDTTNALAALNVAAGTTVVFQASPSAVYVINKELPVPPGVRVTGRGATTERSIESGNLPTLQQAPGTALKCIMASSGYLFGLYGTAQYGSGHQKRYADAGIEIDHLAFDGQNGGSGSGGNTQGHGVVLYSVASKIHDCYFENIAQAAIVVADQNYAGNYSKDQNFENRVVDNHIVNPGTRGIWVTHTNGAIGATDGYLQNNIIESPSQQRRAAGPNINPTTSQPYEGIRMDNAAGWWVVNNKVRLCPGNGLYFNTTWGLHLVNNVLEYFGCHPVPKTTFRGYWIITAGAIKTHPGFISGNLASACEGRNTVEASAPEANNNYEYFSVTMQQESYDIAAWFEQSHNIAHQATQPPAPITGVTVTNGSNTVSAPQGSTRNVQKGMSILDSKNLIPKGTTVGSVSAGTGTSPDTIILSANATGSSSNDTISFPGPTSTAWTYVNNEAGSVMTVHRTNEVVTGTIDALPQVSGTASIDLIDPIGFVGGIPVLGFPGPAKVIMATSGTSAAWATLTNDGPLLGATRFTSSGTYIVPSMASKLRVTCVGGGGGGGAGGAATSAIAQAGGSGGAAGTASEQIVAVGSNSTLEVAVGSGGAGGAGGASAGNNAGGNGGAGHDSTVTGTGVSVRGRGGPGGRGAGGGSTAGVSGAPYGGQQGQFTQRTIAGCGGPSATAGGGPAGATSGGGGGGGAAGSSSGGGGGGAGTSTAAGARGSNGGSEATTGEAGSSGSDGGSGGGGGGGGANGAAGGAGGAGAPGFVIIDVVDWS